ncbi:MAG: hypothetical protein IPO40_24510 [Fibrobacteres bacterium]|nr:hypothetical protein [Fibrobacterota bacterium]
MENSQNTGNVAQSLSGSYVAQKNWEELIVDEKIERMRGIIKQQESAIGQLQVSLHNARKNLKQHAHVNDKVMIVKEAQEYDDSYSSLGFVGASTPSNSNYF